MFSTHRYLMDMRCVFKKRLLHFRSHEQLDLARGTDVEFPPYERRSDGADGLAHQGTCFEIFPMEIVRHEFIDDEKNLGR